MTLYNYTGRTRQGELVSGRMDGDTADAVASRLFSTGITPIDIAMPDAARDLDFADLARKLGFGKPKTSDLVLFSRQMYTITKSGVPLLKGLRGLAASTHNTVLRRTLEEVLRDLEGGRDLATAFSRHPDVFSTLYVSIIRVGESTGTLESAFQRLAQYLGQDQDIQDRMRAAMRYPAITVGVILIAIAILTTFVLPQFAPIFKVLGDNIPLPTRIIMGFSTYTREYWPFILCATTFVVFIVRQYVRTTAGRYLWHKTKLKLPIVGKLTHEAILSRISRSLAISLNAGMPMLQTLSIIAKTAGNDYMTERVVKLRDAIERGEPLSRAASTVGMFPPLVLQMMSVGEETGEISELLDEVAGFYEREVDYALKNLSSAIEPLLVITVGGMVLVLALGVFLPMWEMISKMSSGH